MQLVNRIILHLHGEVEVKSLDRRSVEWPFCRVSLTAKGLSWVSARSAFSILRLTKWNGTTILLFPLECSCISQSRAMGINMLILLKSAVEWPKENA